ncbi:MAG: DHA2 family efflux MFS transporter permease subunit [Salinibacterium sp.]|nr:DHA2 family efflux MFS transporter permease subunit [Salinibacterium sp.]
MASLKTRWVGLVFISIAVALIIVDSTIVNVAIPSIVDELGISSTEVQWVQETYTLVFAALLLVFGTLADRYGRRRLLLIGVVLFAVASIFASLAADGTLLIAARTLQGVGGALMLPASLSIINSTFRGRERAIAFAVWGSTIGGMAAVGPLLGGWLTTYFSWRWAFGINVPLGVIIVIGLLLFVVESREQGIPRRIDIIGAVLSVVLFSSLVFGLIEGRTYGWFFSDNPPSFWTWDISPIPVAFLISAVALAGFIAWGLRRQRRGESTMLAFGLFRIPSFRNGNIAALVVSLGEFGIILSLPLWLQNVLGYDALQTGLVIVALAVGSFVASGFAGAFGNRIAPVLIVRVGILAEIVGLLMVAFSISPTAEWWNIVPGLFVYGFGVGSATAQLTGVILKDVPLDQSGQGSGTQSTSRQVGSALGIAILGTILFTSLGSGLTARLDDQGQLPAAVQQQIVDAVVGSAGTAIPSLDAKSPAVADDARAAFSDATRYSALSAAGFLGLGFLATLRLSGSGRREEVDEA